MEVFVRTALCRCFRGREKGALRCSLWRSSPFEKGEGVTRYEEDTLFLWSRCRSRTDRGQVEVSRPVAPRQRTQAVRRVAKARWGSQREDAHPGAERDGGGQHHDSAGLQRSPPEGGLLAHRRWNGPCRGLQATVHVGSRDREPRGIDHRVIRVEYGAIEEGS